MRNKWRGREGGQCRYNIMKRLKPVYIGVLFSLRLFESFSLLEESPSFRTGDVWWKFRTFWERANSDFLSFLSGTCDVLSVFVVHEPVELFRNVKGRGRRGDYFFFAFYHHRRLMRAESNQVGGAGDKRLGSTGSFFGVHSTTIALHLGNLTW